MYVAFPIMRLSKSGGVRVLVELANGLVKRGHRVCILIARPSKDSSFPINEKVVIKRSNVRRSVPGELWWLSRNIPQDTDAVVATFYLTAYPTAIVTKLCGQKGYYFVQGYEPQFFISASNRKLPAIQRTLARMSYRLPLYQITISTWLQGVLCNVTGQDTPVIHDGVDTTVFFPLPATNKEKDVQTVLVFGSRKSHKGFPDFLEAVRILARQLPDLRLIVVTQDRELVVNAPVPIEIVYPTDDKELARCYSRADVFVFPSLQEGFGLPPLEAMACGTPVVTTDCEGISDFAKDKVNCLVVPVGSPETMAEAINKVLDDRNLAERLSKAGVETAKRFTWDVMADKFENLLITTLT